MSFYYGDYLTKTLGVFIISLLFCNLIYKWICSRNYPPGPVGWPIIGYGFFLGKKPNITLQRLGEKYGSIFSFYTGPQLIICVTEYHMIKDILNLPNTLSRPPHSFDFLVGKGGLGSLNGEDWKEQRRFTMHTMRNLGLGKGLWETMIQEDAIEFVKEIRKRNGKPVFFEPLLARSQIINSLSLLFGRHLDPEAEKEEIEIMYRFNKEMLKHMTSININILLPSMFKVMEVLNIRGLGDFMDLNKKFGAFIEKEVEKRIRCKNEITREDFIGCYLNEIEKKKNDVYTSFTIENLIGDMFILLVGAHDSTVASMGWLLLLMAKHQDIQKKICEEIDREIGRDGTVYYEDKLKLPYTMASVLEMLRWSSISGLFPPRYITESFTFQNYEIPQGAQIICNAYAMMHDPRYFENPMEYKPERFLNSDGTVRLYNVDAYGPFSFGKRNCPGDGIAVMTVYLYFVSMMQKFSIKPPPGKEPDMDYTFAAATIPNPQELCFIER